MNPNRALWEKRYFTEIAAFMRQSGFELLERFYGPTMNAFEAAQSSGRGDEFHNQLVELAKAQNSNTICSISIPATFLRVTVSL